ncbi:hypothetical protein L6452_11369 [Arctium lappa]|uniref:Uncharacterized protein n=1 Tax=Arctium lappa TaxID=4217 RepID=A0ACB9DP81_ARCLA|nr:hypothetical protein L6452_11369 [Arctium lappa]
MPSVLSLEFITSPLVTSFYGGRSCSHRLKRRLMKGDRRDLTCGKSSRCTQLLRYCGIHDLLETHCSSWLMQMDICSHIGLRVTDDVKDLYGLRMHTLESTHRVTKAFSEGELCNGVNEFLKVQDDREEDSSSSLPFKNCEFQKKDVCDDSHPSKIVTQTPEEYLCKCATCPCSCKTLLSPPGAITSEVSTHDDNVTSLGPSAFCSISVPTHSKPVSAMKGSREKRGAAPPVKLTVKWAPDVYDPIPTSVSHVVTNKQPSRHSKKNSKNKQKNTSKSSSSSRGSKGKDKKQVRKRGGRSSSSMSYKLAEHEEEEVTDFREPEPSSMNFHVMNAEQFCGSSFLKRHGTSLHLSSVAEAT